MTRSSSCRRGSRAPRTARCTCPIRRRSASAQMLPDGTVRTVAGSGALGPLGLSVAGGYRDGPAAEAQFNHPAGMARRPRRRAVHRRLVQRVHSQAAERRRVHGARQMRREPRGRRRRGDGAAPPAAVAELRQERDAVDRGLRRGHAVLHARAARHDQDEVLRRRAGHVDLGAAGSGRRHHRGDAATSSTSTTVRRRPIRISARSTTPKTGRSGARTKSSRSATAKRSSPTRVNNNVRYMRLPRAGFDTSFYSRTIAGGELEKGILNAGLRRRRRRSRRASRRRAVSCSRATR